MKAKKKQGSPGLNTINKQTALNVKPPVTDLKPGFLKHIQKRENMQLLLTGLIIGIACFIILRILFPRPSFYYDSYTYIEAARDKKTLSFRPVQYSEFINFFKGFSTSDVALIAAQYFSNLIGNLLLFFTCTYLFNLNKVNKIILFVLIICNPLYLFYSNYILTDSFFSALTIIWFVLLILIMYKPAGYLIFIQLFVLVVLFKLRYNAIIFPVFTALAVVLSKQKLWSKILSIGAGFILIFILIQKTIQKTDELTGIKTFSAFSGWQLANNALHVLRYEKIDTATIEDEETKDVLRYTQGFMDTSLYVQSFTNVTSDYMWNKQSPLKQYIYIYSAKNFYNSYFNTWTALGPVYNNFGKTVILKKPLSYIKHFVLPNTRAYFLPDLEAYNTYGQFSDTINPVATIFYNYPDNKTGATHQSIYNMVFKPWTVIFPVINILFLLLAAWYIISKKYRSQPRLFNYSLLCFTAFYVSNFFFVVLLAPTVFRYHIFIITLLFPFILLLLQKITAKNFKTERSALTLG